MDDHSAREKRAAQSGNIAKLGTLSPRFVTMDDAARYVHERIGNKRAREFGSVILKRRSDGLFVASEPIAGASQTFNWIQLLDRPSASGEFLHPPGYEIVASLHSHPETLASTKQLNPTWTEQQVTAYMGFYSSPDIVFNYQDRRRFSAAYLSGPYTLLKYEHSGSAAEKGYVAWLDGGKFDWNSPDAHSGTLEGFYTKLASVGKLTFLLSSPEWGSSVGEVPSDWTPYQPFSASPLPLAFGPVFEDKAAVLNNAQARIKRQPTVRQRVFVFKQDIGGGYIASRPQVAAALGSLDLEPLPEGPEGWHLDGIYIHSRPRPAEYPKQETGLYQNFVSPLELATQIAQFRHFSSSPHSTLGTCLYIRTRDGAVLSYLFSGSAAESRLFTLVTGGKVSDNGVQTQLQTEELTTKAFLLRVAEAGELTVEQTSDLWDRPGVVGAKWQAFSKTLVPKVGPAFVTADDAARWAHVKIGNRREVEYGGVILKAGTAYYATEPLADQRNSFDHSRLLATSADGSFIAPHGYEIEAFYHSHPADAQQIKTSFPGFTDDQVQIFNTFYSQADQLFSIDNRSVATVHYLSGSDQTLLKYISSGSAREKALYRLIKAPDPALLPTDFEGPIWDLADAGELWVMNASPVWGGVPGRVQRGWKIRQKVTNDTAPQLQPPLSPRYTQADQAVMDSLAGSATNVMGFLLRHTQDEVYVTTQPRSMTEPLFALDGIFPTRADGQRRLPSNFRLAAIYYRFSPTEPVKLPRESWLYDAFFAPVHVAAAIHQAKGTTRIQDSTRGLGLYLLAEDQALLRFNLPLSATPLSRDNPSGATDDNDAESQLRAGTLSARDYVRRVIAAGRVQVIRPGSFWSVAGELDRNHFYLTSRGQELLSLPFLSADDAARHVQQQIGNRDRRYGGYILQRRSDQLFFATAPLESQSNPFAGKLFQDKLSIVPLIPPEAFDIHGRYGSRLALSMSDTQRVAQRGWTREEAMIDAQMFSVEDIHRVLLLDQPGYLLGSADSLLRYTPKSSSHQDRLFQHTGSVPGESDYGKQLADGRLRPAAFVIKVAEAGDLQVLQGNKLWGPRSAVYNDWSPNFEYVPPSGPPPSLAYGPLLASADQACLALHARALGQNWEAQAYFGAVLKDTQRKLYVTTELVPVKSEPQLFRLAQLFPFAREGSQPVLPAGFELDGLFYSQQWQATGDSGTQPDWLGRFFVAPKVLNVAEVQSLTKRAAGSFDGVPVYLSTMDGALLRFRSSTNRKVFGGATTNTSLEQWEKKLGSGAVTAQDFVRHVAQSSQLNVIRTSLCWDVKGPVNALWACYAALERRPLSPVFASADDAVLHVQRHLNTGHARVYGGLILKRTDGHYLATEPAVMPPQGFTVKWVLPDEAVTAGQFPAGCTIVGRYRSVLAWEGPFLLDDNERAVYKQMFPTGALAELMYRDVSLDHDYLIAADGAVLCFSPNRTASQSTLKASLAMPNPVKGDYGDNLMAQALRDGSKTPSQLVDVLSASGILRVVKASPVWGAPRMLVRDFAAYTPAVAPLQIREALADPACTPICARPEDAVRLAQGRVGERTTLKFSYLIKSRKNGHYLATLPLAREDYGQFKQVLPHGQMLQGFELKGLCLFAGTVNIISPGDEMNGHFVAPEDLIKGLGLLRRPGNEGYLPLYLSCVDGALLKYRFTGVNLHLTPKPEPALLRLYWQPGKTTVREFIRDLARAGELDVLVGSAIWARRGRVDSTWQPKVRPDTVRDSDFYGPIFHHTDDAALHSQAQVVPYLATQYLSAVLSRPTLYEVVALEPQAFMSPVDRARLFQPGGPGLTLTPVTPGNHAQPFRLTAIHGLFMAMGSTDSTDPLDRRLVNEFIAAPDLNQFLRILKLHGGILSSFYATSRGGALLRYIPSAKSDDAAAPAWQVARPSEYVSKLRAAGRLTVVVGDGFWKHSGLVDVAWKDTRVGKPLDLPEEEKSLPFWRWREEL